MFSGSIVALVTPMDEKGAVDFKALVALVEWHLEQGTNAIVALGSTGEGSLLTPEERLAVLRKVIDVVNGKIPVIAGSGEASTQVTLELTLAAQECGADACLIVAPPYVRPTQEGLFQHYSYLAHHAAIPQIVYNVPSRTACDILPATLERLAGLPNIIGIKEATGNLERGREILQRCAERLDLYSGDDPTALDLMAIGAKGVISITANVAPKAMQTLCAAALTDRLNEARQINEILAALHKAMIIEANPIPVKWALSQMKKIGPGIRLPLTVLDPSHHEAVRQAMITANVN